jgi:oligoendopeptidase F
MTHDTSSIPGRTAASEPPAWDLSPEYSSFDDPVFISDLARVEVLAAELEGLSPDAASALARAQSLKPEAETGLLVSLRRSAAIEKEIEAIFGNIATYANCVASVDGRNARAKELRGVFSALDARVDKAGSAFHLLVARCSEAFAEAFLASPEAEGLAFSVLQQRKYRDRLLELAEEKVVSSLSPDGLNAWGRLYDAITGTAMAEYRGPDPDREAASGAPATGDAAARVERRMGLAEVASLLRSRDRGVREAAFRAQTEAFSRHDESLAAILNSLSGFRLAEYELRSEKKRMHFLDAALSMNRMEEETLMAMFSVVDEGREIGRRALRLQARLMGIPRLACYDSLAPAPRLGEGKAKVYSFDEGFELVRGAYSSVDPAMGDFVLRMRREGCIESRVLPTKRPGAYCTRFPKSRSQRVFQTYRGALADVSTLAHELGHAYHGSLLSDLPLAEGHYPMNLAETASTFAETALGDYLERQALQGGSLADPADLLELAWSDAQDAATFLINIPARFSFEKALYEKRAEKPLGPEALSALMLDTMKEHYGDALSEYDSGFWKSKLHFYMSGLSFYNFPYTFGYLFSLGVYARREELGSGFHGAYCELLRDTGRMETEALAEKHLGVDLRKPEFWRASLGIVEKKVKRFEEMVEKLAR